MNSFSVLKDPRFFQIAFLSSFLVFGMVGLNWDIEWPVLPVVFGTAILIQLTAIYKFELNWKSVQSAIISGLGLVLLLKANHLYTFGLAAVLAISSKFLIRYKGKHIFNPVNFGIIGTIIISNDAWISPGQWGSEAIYLLAIGIFSWLVLAKVNQLLTGLVFIVSLFVFEVVYLNLYLGWPMDFVFHKFTSGSILLFSFFMITDPRTTPNGSKTRALWAFGIAGISFYLMEFQYFHSAPFWILFFVSPFTPLIDKISKKPQFQWS